MSVAFANSSTGGGYSEYWQVRMTISRHTWLSIFFFFFISPVWITRWLVLSHQVGVDIIKKEMRLSGTVFSHLNFVSLNLTFAQPRFNKKKNHLVELKTNLMLSNIETNEYIHCVALLYKTPASLLLLHVGWNKCCYYRLTQIWQQSEPFTHNITPRRLNCPSPGMMDSPAVGVLYDGKMFSCDRKPPRMIADDGLNNGCDTHKGFCEFELTSLGETEEMDMLRFLN